MTEPVGYQRWQCYLCDVAGEGDISPHMASRQHLAAALEKARFGLLHQKLHIEEIEKSIQSYEHDLKNAQ